MEEQIFKSITTHNIKEVLEIMEQEELKNTSGNYPKDKEWLLKIAEQGYAIAGYYEGKLMSCVFAEKLIDNGLLIWYLCVSPKFHGKFHGTNLLKELERIAKKDGVKWIFLNATRNSLNFYRKNGFETDLYHSNVYEHLKEPLK